MYKAAASFRHQDFVNELLKRSNRNEASARGGRTHGSREMYCASGECRNQSKGNKNAQYCRHTLSREHGPRKLSSSSCHILFSYISGGLGHTDSTIDLCPSESQWQHVSFGKREWLGGLHAVSFSGQGYLGCFLFPVLGCFLFPVGLPSCVIVRSPFRAKHHVVVQYMAGWMKCPLPPSLNHPPPARPPPLARPPSPHWTPPP